MLALLSHYRSRNTVPVFLIRGKEVSLSELQRYAKRARINIREILAVRPDDAGMIAPALRHSSAMEITRQLRPPDEIQTLDKLSHVIVSYLEGAFDAGHWWVDGTETLVWAENEFRAQALSYVSRGLDHYLAGRYTEAGIAWRLVCLKLEKMVLDLDPRTWLLWIDLLLDFNCCGANEYGITLEKHLWRLINIKLGTSSPHFAFARALCSLTREQTERLLPFCSDIVFGTWRRYLSPFGLLHAQLHRGMQYSLRLNIEPTMEPLNEYLARSNVIGQDTTSISKCMDVYNNLCIISEFKDDWFTVERAAKSIRDLCTEFLPPGDQCEYMIVSFTWLGRAHEQLGFLDLAIRELVEASKWYMLCMETLATTLSEGYELSKSYICDLYTRLDRLANNSSLANRDQQWREKIQEIEREWGDELTASVAAISL